MKQETIYECELCHSTFYDKERCERCEKSHYIPKKIESCYYSFELNTGYPKNIIIKFENGSLVKYEAQYELL